jgi:hypothetical protein
MLCLSLLNNIAFAFFNEQKTPPFFFDGSQKYTHTHTWTHPKLGMHPQVIERRQRL